MSILHSIFGLPGLFVQYLKSPWFPSLVGLFSSQYSNFSSWDPPPLTDRLVKDHTFPLLLCTLPKTNVSLNILQCQRNLANLYFWLNISLVRYKKLYWRSSFLFSWNLTKLLLISPFATLRVFNLSL